MFPSRDPNLLSESHLARALSVSFSTPVLLDLARRGRSSQVTRIINELGLASETRGLTYSEFFEACHKLAWRNYRSEYIYKNALLRKLLLGRHSPTTARVFTEFRAEDCKADFVVVNGTTTAYEIKTELDDLDRLERQLAAYLRVFAKVYVVTFEGNGTRLRGSVSNEVGVLELTKRYTLRTLREATEGITRLCPTSIFDSLRRKEYLSLIKTYFGTIPAVPNTKIYSECRRLFAQLRPEKVHAGFVQALRARSLPAPTVELLRTAPPSLSAAILNAELTARESARLTTALEYAVIP